MVNYSRILRPPWVKPQISLSRVLYSMRLPTPEVLSECERNQETYQVCRISYSQTLCTMLWFFQTSKLINKSLSKRHLTIHVHSLDRLSCHRRQLFPNHLSRWIHSRKDRSSKVNRSQMCITFKIDCIWKTLRFVSWSPSFLFSWSSRCHNI
jgi:hypothetical protein